ncbi:protein FAR1-RELATED SEQUENCE 5-like [Vicia villosa]|uniref:protein FAR1-RELATED SEQUENCE 5-like n=1 Tax=Vicia villosa TaxID=3911 RepID=UPI00273BB5EB|nr:protein FAR1-RELATED SEQUENCE 5-like [Vicia villosa]
MVHTDNISSKLSSLVDVSASIDEVVAKVVDVRGDFISKHDLDDRESMLTWIRRKAIDLGFGVVIGRSNNDTARRNPFVTMLCERSGKYNPPLKKFRKDDTGNRERTTGLKDVSTEVVDETGETTIDDISAEDGESIENIINIDSMEDILSMDLKRLSPHETRKIQFSSLDMAYAFYNQYAKMNGFAVCKSNILRSKKGETLERIFVCHRQGFREDRVFNDWHNHDLLHEEYHGMLASHRKMEDSDIMQMNDMLKVGIRPSQFYGSCANQSGGYEKIGFRRKDIYNQIGKQRLLQRCDGKNALHYLHGLASDDPMMFYRHTVDGEGRLEHLFWCDGISQMNFKVFGNVLAFDATYGTNKYHCPLVVFSGVNNHNHNIIFGGAIVANEKEETYVWVLEQILEAMSGKSPISVITDGDLAMKKAIKRVFPNAYHRLCAWHLIRNAMSNIGVPEFVGQFRKCMLGDYDLGEFRRKWTDMIDTFGLHDNKWVTELYAKRNMWATAHIHGG